MWAWTFFSVHIAEQKQQKICQQEQTKVIKARLIARKAHDQKQCSLYDRFSKICGTNHTLCRQNRNKMSSQTPATETDMTAVFQ